MKKLLPILLFTLLLGFAPLSAQIFLNEIIASNQSVNSNSFGEYGDWVELYNASAEEINLLGYYLSDSEEDILRWVFPSCSIPAGGFLLVWATDRDLLSVGGEVHTNFKISLGETITLSSPQQEILDQVTIPSLNPDSTFGRLLDGDSPWAYFPIPSPGQSNQSQNGYLALLSAPIPSFSEGFYTDPINLGFSSVDEDVQIYYTLDGSDPEAGAANTFLYDPAATLYLADRSSEPNGISMIRTTITGSTAWQHNWYPPLGLVKKASIIRVKSSKAGCLDSPIQNLSYFIGTDFATRYPDIPLLSLITPYENFFGDSTGIYVPGTDSEGNPITSAPLANYNQGWERETYIRLWEADRIRGFGTRAITEIHGSGSSVHNRKGLRFELKGSAGIANLSYDLFDNGIVESFDAFVARASGQDVQHSLFRDALAHTFFLDKNVSASLSRPVIAFINGEYWGIHNLRERSDEDFVARIHAADTERMDCLEHSSTANPQVRVGTNLRWLELRNFVRNQDLNLPENYTEIQEFIDLDSFINYYIAEIFVANSDWPNYNLRFWRHKPELDTPGIYLDPNPDNPMLDGRFRWLLFDLDQSLGRFHSYNTNTLQTAAKVGSWDTDLSIVFRKLLGATNADGSPATDPYGTYSNGSDAFRNEFINRFCDALNTNLLASRTTARLDEYQTMYAPFMPEHIQRWQLPASVSTWNSSVTVIRNFLINRPAVIRNQLASKFLLSSGTANLSCNVNDPAMGFIRLNSLKLGANTGFETLPFSGIYYKDVPLKLRAIPNPGYRFVGWNGIDSLADSLLLSLDADLYLTAIFEVDEADFPGDTINPEPWNLNLSAYSFFAFPATTPASVYPPNMRFLMASGADPNINAQMNIPYTSAYNLGSRTRIEGLNGDGIALINTGNPPSGGSTQGYLGAIVLALKTLGQSDLKLNFTLETQIVNERSYGIALQYRIGTEGAFSDLIYNDVPLRYISSTTAGHKQTYFAVPLPPELENQAYIQLMWKYYYISGSSGARPKLRLDDILVYTAVHTIPTDIKINEFMAANVAWDHPLAVDDFGNRSDWIELYNSGNSTQNLLGCYLSDDPNHSGRWMLPSLSIPAGDFVVLRASNQNVQLASAPLHTNFAISTAGEALYLTASDATALDFVPAFPIPADHSYGRIPDASANWQIIPVPSPSSANISIDAPSEVQLSRTDARIYLQWLPVLNATSYKIYAAENPDATDWELLYIVSDPSCELELIDLSDKQFFRIVAIY